jgi:hypothetical protein
MRTALLALGLLLLAGPAAGHREYVDRIPNGGVNDCHNCHSGGSFKDDFRRFGWGARLALEDSDGDGFSNGDELQDPAGSWRPGQPAPGMRTLVSNPSSRKSVPPVPGAPSKKKARCIRKLNAGLVRVAEAAGAELRECVADWAAGESTGPASACAAGIEGAPKVEKRVTRLEKQEARQCLALGSPPPFGANPADEVAAAGLEERTALLGDLFEGDLDGVLASDSDAPADARCQRALLAATDRCGSEALEAFEHCKAKGLKLRRIGGVDDLATCLDQALAGKRQKRCGPDGSKLSKALARRCDETGTDLAVLFPGCGEAAPEDLVACVAERLRCRTCRAVDRADALGADCDLFDDASDDGSCDD